MRRPIWHACRLPEAADSAFLTPSSFQSNCEYSRESFMIFLASRFRDGMAPNRTCILPLVDKPRADLIPHLTRDSANASGL